jgi:predicted nucleic acid-binding protein
MKVVDASVIVDLLLGLIGIDRLGDEDLVAPHLIDSEVLHSLRGRVLGGKLSQAQGDAAVRAFSSFFLERRPVANLHARIWELRHNLSAYDASYIALAEGLDATSLLTRDAALGVSPGVRCRVEVV